MKQAFHSEIAERFGVNAAIIAEYIWSVIKNNEFNGSNLIDGRTWMRHSKFMFTVVMQYLSEYAVDQSLKKLLKGKIIVKNEFNQNRFDRTLWYSFTEYGQKLMEQSEENEI